MPRSYLGCFRAETLAALLDAIPNSDGTCRDIVETSGADVSHRAVAEWLKRGRRDSKDGRPQTAYARFFKEWDTRVSEVVDPGRQRNRELDKAMLLLESRCECGAVKALLPSGQRAEACQQCLAMERRPRRQEAK